MPRRKLPPMHEVDFAELERRVLALAHGEDPQPKRHRSLLNILILGTTLVASPTVVLTLGYLVLTGADAAAIMLTVSSWAAVTALGFICYKEG